MLWLVHYLHSFLVKHPHSFLPVSLTLLHILVSCMLRSIEGYSKVSGQPWILSSVRKKYLVSGYQLLPPFCYICPSPLPPPSLHIAHRPRKFNFDAECSYKSTRIITYLYTLHALADLEKNNILNSKFQFKVSWKQESFQSMGKYFGNSQGHGQT
jgi:hypothetical protein